MIPKSLAMVSLLLVASSVNAATRWHTSPIKYLYPQGNGDFLVMFTLDNVYCPSVENPKRYYISTSHPSVTADGRKNLIAVLLAAFATDRPVQIAFDDSTAACFIDRVMVEQ